MNIQKELTQRIHQNPLKYFWPHQRNCDGSNCDKAVIHCVTYDGKTYIIRGCPQNSFLKSKAHTIAIFGANRSGKTEVGAFRASCHSTGEYPDWWDSRTFFRPTIGRIGCSDFAKGASVVAKKLHKLLPKNSILGIDKNTLKAEVKWYIRHKTGGTSVIDLVTYEQVSDLAEGWDGDWVWFDEPPPRGLYIAVIRGLIDRDGECFFTLTPLKEPWLFDEVYSCKDPDVESFICDMRHNLQRKNPLTKREIGLTEDAIRRWEKKLTEEERETRTHGRFRYLAGRIWKEWDRNIHTYDRSFWMVGKDGVLMDGEPPVHWPRCMLIDPHDRNPHALLWVAVDETNCYWAYREGWLKNTLIEEAVLFIKNKELEARERIAQRVIDPNFGPKQYANSGLTVRDEFEESSRKLGYPLRFSFADDHKELGRKAVANLLKYEADKPLSLLNHPRFVVASDMAECIYQIEHYVWDEYRANTDRDPKEKPREANSHFPDLLQYFSLLNFGWYRPSIKEGRGALYV